MWPPPPPPFEKTLQCTIGFTHGKYAPEGPEGPTFNSSGQTISSHNFNRMVLIKSFFKICCRTHIMAVEKTVLERIVGVMKSSFSEFAITIREHLQVISQLSRLLTTSSVTHSSPVRLREVSASFSSISILPVKWETRYRMFIELSSQNLKRPHMSHILPGIHSNSIC